MDDDLKSVKEGCDIQLQALAHQIAHNDIDLSAAIAAVECSVGRKLTELELRILDLEHNNGRS